MCSAIHSYRVFFLFIWQYCLSRLADAAGDAQNARDPGARTLDAPPPRRLGEAAVALLAATRVAYMRVHAGGKETMQRASLSTPN